MNQAAFDELAAWVTKAGLIGRAENQLMGGFCRRIADAGVPLTRAMVILDTLHPIYEGRVFRWRADMPDDIEAIDYGRTNEGEAAENWQRSPFFHLLQTGAAAPLGSRKSNGLSGRRTNARRGDDRLPGAGSPLCRGRRDRRDGLYLFVMGDRCPA